MVSREVAQVVGADGHRETNRVAIGARDLGLGGQLARQPPGQRVEVVQCGGEGCLQEGQLAAEEAPDVVVGAVVEEDVLHEREVPEDEVEERERERARLQWRRRNLAPVQDGHVLQRRRRQRHWC